MPLETLTTATLNHAAGRSQSGIARLAAAVMGAAIKDLKKSSPAVVDRAKWFFEGGAFRVWADVLGLDYDVVIGGYHWALDNDLPVVDGRAVRYQADEASA